MKQEGLTAAFLKGALRHAGCPVCHVCRDEETRYLRYLLHENVNAVTTRIRISESLGFCRRHSWQLLNMEIRHGVVPLGASIIYEDLLNQVIHRTEAAFSAMSVVTKQGYRERLLDRLRLWIQKQDQQTRHFLEPSKTCRACESSYETAQHTVHVIIRMLCSAEIQQMYIKSDGICLPHLRLVLALTDTNPGIHFLINNTLERLRTLQHDLNEFKRKQHWHHRDETITENEQTAARRAITFFVGEEE